MSSISIQKIGITHVGTDAIVNAANEGLWAGGGVCGAIFKAAGHDKLQAVCNKIGKFTKSEVMELCPTISKASVENAIKQLVDEGLIVRHGTGRSTFYTRSDAGEFGQQ